MLLWSCIHVYFMEPQTKGGERLTEIPEILYGKWSRSIYPSMNISNGTIRKDYILHWDICVP
jgi:hypothetical protein